MHPRSPKASVTLMVLCCVTVLGIALASYLAVSNQAMKLSNRAYAQDVSRHLAEMGLERALSAFTNNTFSSWTLAGNTAAQTFSITSSHYGSSGITGTGNIRVDNYNAFRLNAVWNSSTYYNIDQYVLYSGSWYRCNTAHQNQTPGGANWNSATGSANAAWNASAYNLDDIVSNGGSWYRCLQANTNQAPPNATYWSTAPRLSISWAAGGYNVDDIVYDRGIWYRCTTGHTTSQPPPDASYWASAAAGTWSAATAYSVNQSVSYGGVWYRCLVAHSNQVPNNSTYWTTSAPIIFAEGVATLPDGTSTIKTQLRALIARATLFPNAAAAATNLIFSSGGTIDSYDSSRGTGPLTYNSTSSPYSVGSPNLGFSAVLAGGNTAATAVTVTSATVKGYLTAPSAPTSPYAPRISVGASASLTNADGSVTSPHPTAANVDLTRISRSPYIPQFSVLTPNSGTFTALPASGSLGTATDTTWQTYVYSGNLDISDNRVYTVNGPVRIIVTGRYYQNYSPGNKSVSIVITNNSTAKLEMYIAGDIAIYGLGYGIDNQTRLPRNLAIYATTSLTVPDFNTDIAFHGVIYFSSTAGKFTVLGNRTFYGAISGANLTFSGSPVLHYDTMLRYTTFSGTDRPYMISEWRELTDPAERVVLP